MAWARFDDDVLDNAKLTMVSDLAAHLWWKCIVWSRKQKTNGVVPRHVIATLVRARKPELLAKELVEAIPLGKSAGLFEAIDGGWKIHDFEDFGPQQREELSDARAEAGRRGAAKRWQTDGKRDGKPDGKREVADSKLPSACHAEPMANDSSRAGAPAPAPAPTPAFPSRPVPSRPEEQPQSGGGSEALPYDAKHEAGIALLAAARSDLGGIDDRELRPWGRGLVESVRAMVPADAVPAAYVAAALDKLRDAIAAHPEKPAASRLRYLKTTATGLAAEDKARGWPLGRAAPSASSAPGSAKPRDVDGPSGSW